MSICALQKFIFSLIISAAENVEKKKTYFLGIVRNPLSVETEKGVYLSCEFQYVFREKLFFVEEIDIPRVKHLGELER